MEAFSMEVVVRTIDYFSGPLKSMMSAATAAEGKFANINNAMKMMGKSKGEIDAINASLAKMGDRQAFSNVASDLNKIGTAKSDIAAMESSFMKMRQYQRDMAASQAKYAAGKDMAMSGVGSLAVGAAGAFGVVEMLKQAGDFQDQLVTIQDNTGATNKEMQNFGNVIKQTSAQVSRFNDMQVSGMAKQLASGGFNTIAKVQAVLPTVAKFAEVQAYEGKQSDPSESVKQAIEMAHLYGHYDPKSFMDFLNNFNKYSLMQPGDSTQLEQTMKYLAPTANMLKMSQSSSMALAAVDNTLGLSGSHGGTNSADMIMRLIPGLIGGAPTKKKTPAAWAAMQQLGFIDANGNSSFFNKKGGMVDVNKLLSTMINDSKKFNPMQLTGLYKSIFGIQGGRAAGILANPRSMEQLQRMHGQLGQSKNINQRVDEYQKTASGQLNLMKSNSMSIMLSVSQQLAIALNPVLTKMNSLLTSTLKFSIAHPMFAKIVADLALAAVGGKLFEGSLKLGFGALKMLDGGFGMLKVASKAKELSNLGKVFSGFGKIADGAERVLSRFASSAINVAIKAGSGLGKGLLSAGKVMGRFGLTAVRIGAQMATGLGRGVMSAIRLFGSFGGTLLKLGATAARWAAGLALDWVIGLGPVSWIIAGVTAVIAAGIIAWKTNFLGFRDGLTAVWHTVQSDASSAWHQIESTVQGVVNWFKSLPSQMMSIGASIIEGLAKGITGAVGTVINAVKGVGSTISSAFKSIMKINSPSKVFVAHGSSIVEGLAMGIDRNSSMAIKSTTNLANGVVGAFRPKTPINIASGQMGLNTGTSGNVDNSIHFHSGAIVVNAQPGQDAKSLAKDMYKELGRLLAKDGRNSGSKAVFSF